MERVPFSVAYGRALRLRCPRCGQDQLFSGFFRMNERCTGCGLKYEREPGFFLGSIYVNYGWTSFTMAIAYVVLHFGFELPNRYVVPPLCVYWLAFPAFFHRYARALWLALDCNFDRSDGEDR